MSNLSAIKKYSKFGLLLSSPEAIFVVLNLFTLPVILKYLTQNNFGEIVLSQSIVNWISAFTFVNITTESRIGISKGKIGSVVFAIVHRIKLFAPLYIIILMICLVLIYLKIETITSYLIIALLQVIIFRNIIFESCQILWLSKENFKVWAIWQMIMFAPIPIVSALLAFYTMNPVSVILGQMISAILISLVYFNYMNKKFGLINEYRKKNTDQRIKNYGIKSLPTNIVVTSRSQVVPILIGIFSGYDSLAVFSVAYNRIFEKVLLFVKKVNPIFYNREVESRQISKRMDKKSIIILFLIGVVVAILITLLTAVYTNLFLPSHYRNVIDYVMILSISLPFLILLEFIMLTFRVNLDHYSLNRINIVRFVVILFSIALFGYVNGIVGVCFGITTGNIISLIYGLWIFNKVKNK